VRRTLAAAALLAAVGLTSILALPAGALPAVNYTVRLLVRADHTGPFERFVRVPANTPVKVRAVLTPNPGHSIAYDIVLEAYTNGKFVPFARCPQKPTCSHSVTSSHAGTIAFVAKALTTGNHVLAYAGSVRATWTEPVVVSPYYVFVLTNVASPGNIFVGALSAVQGKLTCDFTDGGLCADAGGADVPVTYTENLGPFTSCADATAAYTAAAMNPHPAFGGEKVYIFGNSYFIDDQSAWCSG
jgi:hypothetical protein